MDTVTREYEIHGEHASIYCEEVLVGIVEGCIVVDDIGPVHFRSKERQYLPSVCFVLPELEWAIRKLILEEIGRMRGELNEIEAALEEEAAGHYEEGG